MVNRCHKQGFTVVELLIVVTILSILAAIAISNYNAYVMRTRRGEGMGALNSIALEQEKYRSNNTTYGALADVWIGTATANGYYNLDISGVTATGYTVTATAQGNQANDSQSGTNCATLTMVLNGLTTTRTPANCWSN